MFGFKYFFSYQCSICNVNKVIFYFALGFRVFNDFNTVVALPFCQHTAKQKFLIQHIIYIWIKQALSSPKVTSD